MSLAVYSGDDESSLNSATAPSTVRSEEEKPIEAEARGHRIWSVAFLIDGKHLVSGGMEGKIRQWRVEDGKEIETPMDASHDIPNIAISRDGGWIVNGTDDGWVMVWDAENREKVTEFRGHGTVVRGVDISPDGTKIATASSDGTACVWSFSTGERLLGPWQHYNHVATVKFSPDGRLIATATYDRTSVQIHDSQDGRLVVDVPIQVGSLNESLAWAGDSKQLFALSCDGDIHCLDASSGTPLSQWPIHKGHEPRCISLSSNEAFIAATTFSSVSFWDTRTHKQIGSIFDYPSRVNSIAISAKYDMAIAADATITILRLSSVLPSFYVGGCTRNEKAHLEKVIQSLSAQEATSNSKITNLEQALGQLRIELADFQQKANRLLLAHEQKPQCEALYADGRIADAANVLLGVTDNGAEEVTANHPIMDWLVEFTNRCTSKLEIIGDQQSSAGKRDEALASYSTALLLGPSTPDTIINKWADMVLTRGSANEALDAAVKFKVPRFIIYRTISDTLERDDHVTEAAECFRRMKGELAEGTHDGLARWELDFRERCVNKLVRLGNVSMELKDNDAAIQYYSDALMLDPKNRYDVLLKRSKARTFMFLWDDALADLDKAIELDPSLPCGYESKYVALLGACRYDEAIAAYNDMLTSLEKSSDPVACASRNNYVRPSQTIAVIRSSAKQHQRDIPLILINTDNGCLCDAHERIDEFEADPKFKELVASMTKLDNSRIKHTIEEFFRYATFSHTWQGAEPLFNDVLRASSVYKLAASSTTLKLVMFCTIARQAGLRWAWCDTCCINKADGSVLQESLASMFKWYHNSSLTIVQLKGVLSDSELGALIKCLWNTRAWTLQEFFASRVIRFYTEDWKPYLPHESTYNHKQSPAMMREMAAAAGVDAQVLLSLHPGSDNVRQKLCLAATRTATKQEDIAYSLFGIFDVSIQATYGEGQQRALGRLLHEVLTQSGDVTVLAWTGKASEYNSSLPAELAVYRQPASLHMSLIEDGEMDGLVAEPWTFAGIHDSAMILYDKVCRVPSPRFSSRRLSLSCIMFQLRGLSVSRNDGQRVYCAVTSALGKVEIKTAEELSHHNNLVLVHPWLRCLLDPVTLEDRNMDDVAEPLTPVDEFDGDRDFDAAFTDVISLSTSDSVSPPHPASQPPLGELTRALRLFARLRQPFGALLLERHGQSHTEYRRVASDQLITTQLLKNVSPRYLAEKIETIDIL